MQVTGKLDKPGHTRVEIRCIIRADARPCDHIASNCRSETKDLHHCGRRCWGVDEVFPSDTCDNNENKKEEKPRAVLVPEEDSQTVPGDVRDNTHKLRTLSPQKDTYPSNRIRNRSNTGELRSLTKREIVEMITIPTLTKSVRFKVTWHVIP